MRIDRLDPVTLPAATGNYTHGVAVSGVTRMVYVSGQPPWGGDLPDDFEAQCRLAWSNVLAVLAEAGLTAENLAKVTTFLSSRDHRAANSRIRAEVLGEHRPALTVVVCDIYAEEWLLEIEATAVG